MARLLLFDAKQCCCGRAVAFKVYDVNTDGFVSDDDLLFVLKLMVGDNLAEDQVKLIVKRTITAADKGTSAVLCMHECAKAN